MSPGTTLGKVPKTFLRNPSVKGVFPRPVFLVPKKFADLGVPHPVCGQKSKIVCQNRPFSHRKQCFWAIFQPILGLRTNSVKKFLEPSLTSIHHHMEFALSILCSPEGCFPSIKSGACLPLGHRPLRHRDLAVHHREQCFPALDPRQLRLCGKLQLAGAELST